MGTAAALHGPPVGRDLVGAVDRDVEPRHALERLDLDPQLPRRGLGPRRRRHAMQAQAALGQGREQVRHRGAGSQAHDRTVVDEGRRRLGRDALLVFDIGHGEAAYPGDGHAVWKANSHAALSDALAGTAMLPGRMPPLPA